MGYTYRGTIRDVKPLAPQPRAPSTPGPKPKPRVFDPSKCGTTAGYKHHEATNTPKCQPCKDANAAYSRTYGVRLRAGEVMRAFNPDACGTYAGYHRHKRARIPACTPCRTAKRHYMAALNTKKKSAKPIVRAYNH